MASAIRSQPVLRAGILGGYVLLVEWTRSLAGGLPHAAAPSLVLGGGALALAAWGWPAAGLGLGTSRFALRVLGGLALAAVLILPAAVRAAGTPIIPADLALAAVAVSVGEELAFRGALFAALEEIGGAPLAVVGTTALWTAAHALSHPPQFLAAVAAAGLLLGLWRWACKDLVGPVIAHVIADLAL